jgi:hypothetical protein
MDVPSHLSVTGCAPEIDSDQSLSQKDDWPLQNYSVNQSEITELQAASESEMSDLPALRFGDQAIWLTGDIESAGWEA